jgi:hypothetical protein
MDRQIDFFMGTATFPINMQSGSSKQTYKGMFKVKCVLTPLEFIKSDAMYRELLGKTNPEYATEYVSQLCYALSQLKFRVIEAPDWFKEGANIDGSNVDDVILLKILDEAVQSEQEYRTGIEERYEKARGEIQSAIDDGTLNDGEVVEEENDIDDKEEDNEEDS